MRTRRGGVVLLVRASTKSMPDLTIAPRRGRRSLATAHIRRLGTSRRRIRLTPRRRLRPGRYQLTVSREGVPLARRSLRIR